MKKILRYIIVLLAMLIREALLYIIFWFLFIDSFIKMIYYVLNISYKSFLPSDYYDLYY